MSYLGNSPELNTFTVGVEKFNGSGACTTFTLTRSVSDPNYLEVVVSGVQQTPIDNYNVSSGVLTFVTPPALGTNNVVVIYRTGTTIAYNQISASQVLANSVTATAIAPGSVTNSKIAAGSITGDKLTDGVISSNSIVLGAITTNLIASQAISGNQIGLGAITGNNFAGPITGNMIGTGAITGNNFAEPITGNLIGIKAVSGNQIGLGAISSNHFAGGGVTSDVLSSNLSISTVRVAETVNVVTSGISGNYNIHVANSTAYYFVANTTGSVTFNLVANDATATGTTGTLNDLLKVGQTASLAIALKQGATRYRANVFIDGVNPLSNVFWMGATQPAQLTSQTQSIDTYSITVIKVAPSSYTIMVGNTTFGYANGSGMGPGGVQ